MDSSRTLIKIYVVLSTHQKEVLILRHWRKYRVGLRSSDIFFWAFYAPSPGAALSFTPQPSISQSRASDFLDIGKPYINFYCSENIAPDKRVTKLVTKM